MRLGMHILICVLLAEDITVNAQNLVPNPSFEEYTECPIDCNEGEPLQCTPWTRGNDGTPDYFNTCAWGNPGVPGNCVGNQWPVSGKAYVGLLARINNHNWREYIQAPLNVPLIADSAYLVSFYISLADNQYCGIQPFGALFTINPPAYTGLDVLDYTPQVEVNGDFLSENEEWILISRCFVAEGGEQFITIGNFRDDDHSPVDTDCVFGNNVAYYYLDSVSVKKMPVSFDELVMDPVIACPPYEIDPGMADSYHWSDGTTNPTLMVTQSGTYAVTLSIGCAFSTGEIDVTILPSAPPVALPNDTVLCVGETLDISLDGNAGDYVWQDGSTNSEYIISSGGTYSVAMTDDCDVTTDTIVVTFLGNPEPFSLGEDTVVCNGDAYTISFDATLGNFTWQDGSNTPSYTIDHNGTYALTISNQCGQASDAIDVEFVDPLVLDLGPDQQHLCEGDSIVIDLDPNLGDFLWQDGSTQNTYSITSGGTFSVTITNACYTASDGMDVLMYSPPVFSLGPDMIVCPGQLPLAIDLSGVPFAEEYEWSDGSTEWIRQIDAAGAYSVTISNSCFSFSDTIQITVEDGNPMVTLPPDQSLCPGQSLVLDAGGLQGSYLWQDSSTADTLLVTAPGTYMLTVTNVCGSGADTVVVDYTAPLSPPDLGSDFSLCPGESAVLYANTQNVTYSWQDSSIADSLVISAPGRYWLQIADGCTTATDTVVVTSNANPPNVDLPTSVDLCEGDTILLEAGIAGVQYHWSDNSTMASLSVFTAGTYSLTVSNACGTDSDSILVMDAGPPPMVSLGADTAICAGDASTLIPVYSDVVSWMWQDGSNTATFNVTGPGMYSVEGSNDCGTIADTIVVDALPAVPALDLGPDFALCPGESQTLTINAPGTDILWNDGSMDSTYQVSSGGLVYATISNACGSASDTVMVDVLDPIPTLDLGNDQSLCPGETITINPGISGVNYLWQDGSTAPTYEATTPGLIILAISNACGSSIDSLEIIADTNGPHIDLGEDVLACEGDTVVLKAGISGVDYLWQDGSTQPELMVTTSGTYSVQVSNACGMDADTVQVQVEGTGPVPALGGDTILCEGEILQLTATADSATSVLWQDGSTASQYSVTEPGTYILSESNHCGSASDTVVIDFDSAPEPFDLGEDVVLCPGDSVVLNAPATNDLITWQDGTHGTTYVANQEGIYSLELSNMCGTSSDALSVSFDELIPEILLDSMLSLCEGESMTLDATQSFDAQYAWSTGSTSPFIEIAKPGDYAVTVSTECYSTEGTVHVGLSHDCNGIYIPNVFSPNGDNINDEWVVHINDPNVIGVQCRIFDRWGDLLYETTTVPIEWNGRFKDQSILPGVYVYVLKLNYADAETRFLSGDITLFR